MDEKSEAMKVIGQRIMLYEIQKQILGAKNKGKTITEDWILKILNSLNSYQISQEDNWEIGKYIDSDIDYMILESSLNIAKVLNDFIEGGNKND